VKIGGGPKEIQFNRTHPVGAPGTTWMKSASRPSDPVPSRAARPALVVAHGADEDHFLTQPAGVDREIESGAAKPGRVRENVPENFTDADNSSQENSAYQPVPETACPGTGLPETDRLRHPP